MDGVDGFDYSFGFDYANSFAYDCAYGNRKGPHKQS